MKSKLKIILSLLILGLFIFSLMYSKYDIKNKKQPIFKKEVSKEISPYNNDLKDKESFYDEYDTNLDLSKNESDEEPASYNFETDEEASEIKDADKDEKNVQEGEGDEPTDEEINYSEVNMNNFELLAVDFVTNLLTDEEADLVTDDLKEKYANELSKMSPYKELNGVIDFDNFTTDFNNRFLEIMTEDGEDYRFQFGLLEGKLASCKLVVD